MGKSYFQVTDTLCRKYPHTYKIMCVDTIYSLMPHWILCYVSLTSVYKDTGGFMFLIPRLHQIFVTHQFYRYYDVIDITPKL